MKDLMFPKVYSVKKKKKSVNRVKKTPLKSLERKADTLAGAKCRAKGKCAKCGTTEGITWAHIIRRKQSKKLRWDRDNCLPLCWSCHYGFENNPDNWHYWLDTNYPGLHTRLMARRDSLENVKVNREYMERIISELEHE